MNIKIPKPCHEDWSSMSPKEQGRYCGVCAKVVIDFTNMADYQVVEYFRTEKGKTCGRFRLDQIKGNESVSLSPSLLFRTTSYRQFVILALFLAFGTSLFTGCTEKGAPLGKVIIVDSASIETIDTTTPKKIVVDTPEKLNPKWLPPPAPPIQGEVMITGDVICEKPEVTVESHIEIFEIMGDTVGIDPKDSIEDN